MKFWIRIMTFCLLALGSCSKSETAAPAEDAAISCDTTGEAIVQRMVLNENGTEFFYYLQFDASFADEQIVFPNGLPVTFKVEGMKVKVDFARTQDLHTFIVCLAGHQIDPANPDIQSMPVVQVCEAEKSAS